MFQMLTAGLSHSSHTCRLIRRSWLGACLLALAALVVPSHVMAATCTTSFTVASGGSYQFSAVDCDTVGSGTAAPGSWIITAPSHGTITRTALPNLVVGTGVTYTNNGDGATSDSFTWQSSDGVNHTVSVTILPPASSITLSPASFSFTLGSTVNTTFSAGGGTGPYTYAVTAGTLPTGLSLASNGTLSGEVKGFGSYNFTVTATDSTNATGSKAYTGTIATSPPTISPSSLPSGFVGRAYSQTLTASGGVAPYTFSLDSSSSPLPPGLTLSSSGAISGTPTTANTYSNIKVDVVDSSVDMSGAGGVNGSQQIYSITVSPQPTITLSPTSLSAATVGQAYTPTAITASGGTAPYTYQVSSGALPAGMNLSSSGTLSGTPTAGGIFNFTVKATDANGFTGSQVETLTVNAATITLSPSTLPAGTDGTAYSQTITASGGTASYTYAVTSGTLPTGLSLSAGGVLSGTPAGSGSFNFTVTATDSSTGTGAPYTGSQAYVLTINAAAPVANPVTATVAYDSTANPITLNITGGTPTSVAIASQASHGTATASGTAITYTPTAGYAGSDSFTYTASNGAGTSAPATVSITVSNPTLVITASGSLNAKVGQAYSQTFTFSGGAAPYSGYSITGIPAGLGVTAFNSTSITVSGTPTVSGAFQLTVKGTDSSIGNGPFTVSQNFGLNIASATMAISPSTVPGATAGTPYTQTFNTYGGIAPYTYTVTSGALPTGLSLSASGILSGTPTTTGNYNFTVTSTDASTGAGSPAKTQTAYTLTVSAPTLTVTPANLPSATGGSAYSQTLSASGGNASYTYAVTTGSLPAGMSLSSSGVLSGTPMALGNFPFTVTITDSLGFTGIKAYTLTVASPALTVTPASLPGITKGVAYKQTLSTSGGTAPYTYAVTTGALPTGLSLSSNGVLSGTATAPGNFTFTVTATDSIGAIGTHAYSVTVIARPDPSKDPEVLGILNAQAQATRTLIRAQIDNFNSRLEQLHQGGSRVFENNLHVSFVQQQQLWAPEAALDPNQRYLAYDTNRVVSDAPPPNAQPPASSGQAPNGPVSFWVGGGISIGSQQERNNTLGMDFHVSGLSMGVDTRLSDKAVIGAGLGYGQGHVDIGNSGSENRTRAYNAAVYGSLNPAPSLYLDAVVGYQRLSFDSTRYITNVGGTVTGSRHGNQVFGSFSLSQEGHYGSVYLAPYGRFDIASARLDAYTEQGNALYVLHYERQTVRTVSGAAGVRAHWDIVRHSWQFQPMLRVEYRHDFQGNGVAMMQYTDQNSGPLYLATLDDRSSNNWMAGVGLQIRNRLGQSLSVEYQDQIQRGGRHGQTKYLQLNLKIPY